MSNPLSFTFYTTPGLADLRAQVFDSAGTNSGAAISTGFIERGTNGMYIWFGDPGDNFTGGVEFYSNAAPTNILAIRDISPKEVENNDVKTSTLATQTSVDAIDTAIAALNNLSVADLADLATAAAVTNVQTDTDAIQSAITALSLILAQVRAGVVGRSVADDANDPTEIEYYAEDDTTVLFTHTLTDTERTVT